MAVNDDLEEKKRRKKLQEEAAKARAEQKRVVQTQVDKTQEEAAYARGKQSQAAVQTDKTREESRPVQQQTAAQRGYDPRFDDPNYGKKSKPKGNVNQPPPQMASAQREQEQNQPRPLAPLEPFSSEPTRPPAINMDLARQQYESTRQQQATQEPLTGLEPFRPRREPTPLPLLDPWFDEGWRAPQAPPQGTIEGLRPLSAPEPMPRIGAQYYPVQPNTQGQEPITGLRPLSPGMPEMTTRYYPVQPNTQEQEPITGLRPLNEQGTQQYLPIAPNEGTPQGVGTLRPLSPGMPEMTTRYYPVQPNTEEQEPITGLKPLGDAQEVDPGYRGGVLGAVGNAFGAAANWFSQPWIEEQPNAFELLAQEPGYRKFQDAREERWNELESTGNDYEAGDWLLPVPTDSLVTAMGGAAANLALEGYRAARETFEQTSLGEAYQYGLGYVGNVASDAVGALGVPADLAKTVEIPGSENSLGEGARAAYETAAYPSDGRQAAIDQTVQDVKQNYQDAEGFWDSIAAVGWGVGQLLGTSVTTALNDYGANKEKFRKVREYVEKSSDPDADFALLNVYSGADAQVATLSEITNQDTNVEAMRAQAQQMKLEANNPGSDLTPEQRDALNYQAAQLGMQATRLASLTPTQIVEKYMNPLAELAGTFAIDPLNLIDPISSLVGITPEARRMAGAISAVDVTPEAAAQKLAGALAELPDELVGSSRNGFIANLLPTASTPDARASIATNTWYQTFVNLFNGVSTNDQARVIVNAIADDPSLLVKGLDDGKRIGAGALGNQQVVNNLDVLSAASDELRKLKSIAQDGSFDVVGAMAEIDSVIYDAAKAVHGVTDPSALAQAVRWPDKVQRALMSEMWLAMRPTHWIRNAASATFHLLTDGIMTFRPKEQLLGDLKRMAGAIPEQWIAEALGDVKRGVNLAGAGEIETGNTLLGKTPIVGPLLDKVVNAGNAVWTSIDSPIGESNFRLRGYTTAFTRAFESVWDSAVANRLSPQLQQLGIAPDMVQTLAGVAQDAARTSGKTDAIEFFRKAISNSATARSMADLGVVDGILNNQTVKAIYDVILQSPGSALDEVGAVIDGLLDSDMAKWQSIVAQTPPQPGRSVFSAAESTKAYAQYVEDYATAMRRAGLDPTEAKQQAATLMQSVAEAEQANIQAVLDDAVRAGNPDAMRVATDFWGKLMLMKDEARAVTDKLSKDAIAAGFGPKADALWKAKAEGMVQLYSDWPHRLQALADEARIALDAVANGQPLPPRSDTVFDMMERIAQLDPREVERLRAMAPGSVSSDSELYGRVIQASRDYVDMNAANTYSALRRYPSPDAIDIFVSAETDIQALGSHAAAEIRLLQEKLKTGAITSERYNDLRNKLWFETAVASAERHNVATREIVLAGEAQKTATKLTFTDAQGQQYRLLSLGDETAQVRGSSGNLMDIPIQQVPPQVLNDYRQVTGQANAVADQIVQEIVSQNPQYTGAYLQGAPSPRNPMGAQALDEAAGAREARDAMRAAWDQVAVAEVGTPKLDALILSYKRNGVISFGDDFPYEDLLGRNVAGYQLDTQADVERFISEYARLYDTVQGGADVARQARRYANKTPSQILAERGADLQSTFGFTDADLRSMTKEELLGFLESVDGVDMRGWDEVFYQFDEAAEFKKLQQKQPYFVNVDDYNWYGLQGTDGNLSEFITAANKGVEAAGGATDLQIGKMAQWQVDEINKVRAALKAKLPELLNGTREAMSQAQQLRAIDAFKALLPEWDNAVTAGQKAGTALSNFAMLDFANRRNIDTWLSLIMPYHYWRTRSAINWAERTIFKPHILAAYGKSNYAAEVAGEQQGNSASKVADKIPIGDTEYWVANGLNYVLPFDLYQTNSFANPDEAQTALRRTQQNVSRLTGGMLPLYEEVSKWWENPDDYDPGTLLYNYSPYVKLGADIYRWRTGKTLSWAHDAYDPGRIANEVAVMTQTGEVDPTLAKFAQDIAYQTVSEMGPLPEQPEEAAKVYEDAAKRMGYDSVIAWLGANLTGVPIRRYAQDEQQLREASSDYRLLGYDPLMNPTGSKAAQEYHLEENPGVTVRWNVANTYPGADEEENFMRPGVSAVNELKGAETDQIYGDMGKTVEEFLLATPDATRAQVNELKAPYYEQAEALDEKYPSAQAYSGSGGPPKGMDPQETQAYNLQKFLASIKSFPGKPEYPADPTPENKRAYYAELAAWDAKREQYVANVMGSRLTDPEAQALYSAEARATDPKDLIFGYENRYAGPNELAWLKELEEKEMASQAEWTQNYKNVEDRLGADYMDVAQGFYDTAKDSPEREAYTAAHPEMQVIHMAMYNPERYDALAAQFGEDAIMAWSNKPAYDPNNTEASNRALSAYYAQHPEAEQIQYWVKGRPKPEGTPYQIANSYGAEYQEAIDIFGDNIWQVHAQYDPSWDKKTKAQFFQANPEYSGFMSWYYEYKDQVYDAQKWPMPPDAVDEMGQPVTPGTTAQPGAPAGGAPLASAPGAPTTPEQANMWTSGAPAAPDPATAWIQDAQQRLGMAGDPSNMWVSGRDSSYYQQRVEEKRMADPDYRAYVETQNNIRSSYGDEGVALWDQYMALPKGEARKEFQNANPLVKAIRMAAYEPEAYNQAVEMFGDEAWSVWANIPPYDPDNADASRAVREDYYRMHPEAKLMGAWVYGRPGSGKESAEDSYDFGVDYATAVEMFGENIWDLYAQYSTQWRKEQKKKFYEDNPQFGDFFDWWYGDSGEAGQKHSSGTFGGRRFGGGGGGGGGGAGRAFSAPFTSNTLRARLLDASLFVDAPRRGFQAPRPQIPVRVPDIGPDRLEPWRRSKTWSRK